MSLKKRLQTQLAGSRRFTEGLLQDFKSPEEWTHQVHPHANHALWFVGHMGVSDNFFISQVDASRAESREGYLEKFGPGSEPVADAASYPPIEEILDYMHDRRQVLMELLDNFSDAELAQPTPEGAPDFLPDMASVFSTASWHEGLHSGQVTIARRALGHPPMMTPPGS